MSDLGSEMGEISDAMKEKILLSILKNQFHQNVSSEPEISDITESLASANVAEGRSGSGDHSTVVPENRKTSEHSDQKVNESDNQSLHAAENSMDKGKQRIPPTSVPRDQAVDDSKGHLAFEGTASGNEKPAVSKDMQTEISENRETELPKDKDKAVPDDNETTTPEKKDALVPPESDKEESDPIKEMEQMLAAEEADLSPDQLKKRHEESQSLRARANNLYKDSAFNDAALKYSEALQICPLKEAKDRSILYANRAAALMAGNCNKEALPDLNRALELDPSYLKALERRARLNKLLDHLDDSLKDYEKLLELRPKHYAYIATIKELQEQIKKRDEELKAKMMDSLKQLGNVFLKPFGLSTENFSMVPNEGGGYSLQMKGHQ